MRNRILFSALLSLQVLASGCCYSVVSKQLGAATGCLVLPLDVVTSPVQAGLYLHMCASEWLESRNEEIARLDRIRGLDDYIRDIEKNSWRLGVEASPMPVCVSRGSNKSYSREEDEELTDGVPQLLSNPALVIDEERLIRLVRESMQLKATHLKSERLNAAFRRPEWTSEGLRAVAPEMRREFANLEQKELRARDMEGFVAYLDNPKLPRDVLSEFASPEFDLNNAFSRSYDELDVVRRFASRRLGRAERKAENLK